MIVAHDVTELRLVLHVVDARTDIDQGLEHRVGGDVFHPLAIDVDLAAVANGIAILSSGTDHGTLPDC